MIAPADVASSTSDSLMAPTPRWMTSTFTSVVLSWQQRIRQRLHGAVHVALDDQVQRGGLALRQHAADVRQLHAAALDAQLLLALQPLPRAGNLAGRSASMATSVSPAPGTPEMPRICTGMPGPACSHRLAALVEHGAHAAVVVAADERVADAQRAVGDEHRRHRPLPTSSCASTTVPCAGRSGFAFRSRTSACSRIFSSRSGTPMPFFALTSADSTSPPKSSTTTPCCSRSCLILDGSRPAGRSC
jgi:hypothetical protein